MKPLALSAYRVAKAIGVLPNRRTAEPHPRHCVRETQYHAGHGAGLAKLFSNSDELWMYLQHYYDFEREIKASAEAIDAIQPLAADA